MQKTIPNFILLANFCPLVFRFVNQCSRITYARKKNLYLRMTLTYVQKFLFSRRNVPPSCRSTIASSPVAILVGATHCIRNELIACVAAPRYCSVYKLASFFFTFYLFVVCLGHKKHYTTQVCRNTTGNAISGIVSLITRSVDPCDLYLLEALMIEENIPFINVQVNDFNCTLKTFN